MINELNDHILSSDIQQIHRLNSELDHLMAEGNNDSLFVRLRLMQKVADSAMDRLNTLKKK